MSDRPVRRRHRRPPWRRRLVAVAAAVVLASCGSAGVGDRGGPADGTILVFAAASLTEVMIEAERAFETTNPGVDVQVNLAGSASLRSQIVEGAPADVVATADPETMGDLVDAGRVTETPATLATNRLVIGVAPGNPAGVDDLGDLTDPSLFVGLCAAEVPCGAVADRSLAAAGIVVEADTREPDVRSLLTKIEAGELDVGLVYTTDVAASTAGVIGLDLPAGLPTTTDYPIAPVAGTAAPTTVDAFISFLTGPDGRRILTGHGFEVP